MVRDGLYVVAVGASTPVGRDALSSAAAVRAGISGFTEHPFMIDTAGEPMRVARAPWLDLDCDPYDRFAALLIPALEQTVEPLQLLGDRTLRLALALGLPSPKPGVPADLEPRLAALVADRFPGLFVAIATFPVGHAGGLLGLHAAFLKLSHGAFDACVVAGVDSYLEPETLEWLEGNDQLHGAGRLNNAWGLIPGEAAGAALVANVATAERLPFPPVARLLSVGCGFEEKRIKTETVCIGEGLTTAFRAALTGLPAGERVTDVFSDMNGEPYRADEFGFAALRTNESFVSASDFIAPADCWGDVSAASGPLALALSTIAGHKAYANGSYVLVSASSESGERGAALLELPRRER
jgi:3-oxoacyl-[acyl-carrier-protein] synthase-1